MNFSNPTGIKIGMEADFARKHYRVVGRVVLGVVEDGEVWYWQEYNLETDAGEVATLVYEASDYHVQWRLFTMFEPQFPISAADAAAKRYGDLINLDGDDCRVTRVDRSQVYFVEGKAPEGEVAGAHANYFNANAGNKMTVVSWTGEEVECYHGIDITASVVASAFNLKTGDLVKFHLVHYANVSKSNQGVTVVFLIAGILVLFALRADIGIRRRAVAVKTYKSPSSSFELSGQGALNDMKYGIDARALVRVDEVGVRSERREYYLTSDDGKDALLIQGMEPGKADWVLFTPLKPDEAITPEQAARVATGQIVKVGGLTAVVTDLFRSTVVTVDGTSGESPGRAGSEQYGFLARRNETLLMARWNAFGITFWQGTSVTELEIKKFKSGH